MKRVSFEVAKAIKEAGYPQKITDEVYVTKDIDEFEEGELVNRFYSSWAWNEIVDAPFVLDVWLWLWREKKISVMMAQNEDDMWEADIMYGQKYIATNDPEDAIIAAIEHLVKKDLIK